MTDYDEDDVAVVAICVGLVLILILAVYDAGYTHGLRSGQCTWSEYEDAR